MTGPRQPDRMSGLNRLFVAIQDATDGGELVPCIDKKRGHLWLSEDLDEQYAAALGCRGCPALNACRSYVTQWPERSGVWGGRVGKRDVMPNDRQVTRHESSNARVVDGGDRRG